jgi:spore coat protein U-like protein
VTRVRSLALWALAGAVLTVAGARPASAAAKCVISSVSGVAFGVYDVDSPAPLDSNGAIRLDCNGAAFAVTVNLSRGNAPTYNPRFMLNGLERLYYNLYTDAARTSIWGDATGGTSRIGVFNPPNVIDLFVYGRIPALQDLPPGTYVDTIVVTVNF